MCQRPALARALCHFVVRATPFLACRALARMPSMPDPASTHGLHAAPYPDREGRLGFYPASTFELTTGADPAARLDASARYYFADQLVAVPRPRVPVADYTRGAGALKDLLEWTARPHPDTPAPPLVWIASSRSFRGARVSRDGSAVTIDGSRYALALHPRLALNRSYFDATSARYLARRSTTIRGELHGGTVIARSFWPEDYRLDLGALPPPDAGAPLTAMALRAHMRASTDEFAARVLWRRSAAPSDARPRAVVAFVVNGSQGDDDEAWGGHFAVCTGSLDASGRIDELLVNNFYSPDVVSEKGILPAPLPLDRYQADLNSGQAWYRPSWLLVATLTDRAAAELVQGGFNRMYLQLWRHQLHYNHATMNCAGISIDVLRALGLPVAARGPSTRLGAWLAIPHALIVQRSIERARLTYEYLTEDRTRLLPAVSFEECAALLIRLAQGRETPRGRLAQLLARDVETIALVDLPQLPSSRARGAWPVASAGEYRRAIPSDPRKMKIIPLPPRPFPERLRDADLLPAARRRSDLPLATWFALPILGAAGYLLWRHANDRARRDH